MFTFRLRLMVGRISCGLRVPALRFPCGRGKKWSDGSGYWVAVYVAWLDLAITGHVCRIIILC